MKLFLKPGITVIKTALMLVIMILSGRQVFAQANDNCASPVNLVSATTCTPTAGAITAASFTAASISTLGCGTNNRNDVWYTFTAKTTNPVITLTALTGMANARLQLFSGSCGSLVSIICGTTGSPVTMSPTGLTVGTLYFIRVYCTPNATGTFNICVTDPAPPVNDNCSGATLLTSGTSCSNTAGTLLNATGTAGIPGDCGAVGSPEVWYKYTATSPYPVITISSPGANFTAAGPRIQLLSGTCAGFTSLACVSGSSLDAYAQGIAPLVPGNTYYVRIYTNSATMSGTAWNFNICIVEQPSVDYGKSYLNITKGASGGTVEPGDVLEVRAIFVLKSGTVTLASFLDTIPTNTTYLPNTLRILTNEGQIYKQWTDAALDDAAKILAGSYITINLGAGATDIIGGTVKNTDRPTNFGSTCIMIASYRVTVNAVAYGSPVDIGGGKFSYTNPNNNISTINFPQVTAIVYKNYGICSNTIGSNGVLSESGGTFGSGNNKDRVAGSGKIPANYTKVPFSNGNPSDYFYGISNNSSSGGANYSIIPNDPIAANHVFNVWDIIGDHTGAAIPTAGNPPADTTGGKTGGYMVVINAAFRTDTAFLDTVKNLCPNTYYEYSAWFRNICKKCSGDSTGKSPNTPGYIPTGPGDSSGVHPNLTFNINGYDYYTTGDILYTGQWIKKGFTYLTGPAQTQMIISIRNNAPGGGGNDWAIDDIGVSTCTPNLALTPSSPTTNVCYGDGTSLSASVESYFSNYTEYIWERSIDNGVSWTSTGYSGTGTPVFNGTEYVYTAVGPSFIGDSSHHNNIYRLRVASTAANLADPNCSFSGSRLIQVYVNNCLNILKTDITSLTGQLKNNYSAIQWQTVNETGKTIYDLEKSTDGIHFTIIGTVRGNAINGIGTYTYKDPEVLSSAAYYRIKVREGAGFKHSKILLLSPGELHFAIKNIVNPFSGTMQFDVVLPGQGDIKASIYDNYGRIVKIVTQQQAERGITSIKITDLEVISNGIYTLKVAWQQETISKQVIKTGN